MASSALRLWPFSERGTRHHQLICTDVDQELNDKEEALTSEDRDQSAIQKAGERANATFSSLPGPPMRSQPGSGVPIRQLFDRGFAREVSEPRGDVMRRGCHMTHFHVPRKPNFNLPSSSTTETSHTWCELIGMSPCFFDVKTYWFPILNDNGYYDINFPAINQIAFC